MNIYIYIYLRKNLYQDSFKLALLASLVSTIIAESKTYQNTIKL